MLESVDSGNDIEGLIVSPLKQIVDARGKVMHMLRCDSAMYHKFGEIYFSQINPGVVKAWKKHFKMTQNIAVPIGCVDIVLYDDRYMSKSCGLVNKFEIGENEYNLIQIPPLVWYGFKAISDIPALVVNCTDLPHDPEEVIRYNKNDTRIPYQW